ncbi:cell wall metabolism sensor histidine kinase WalK [Paenibacillus sp. OV219]|uniref:sensor histidine kinase n=1 Tax=Paenibacillus sp. OV219 TaxID=1884377 RepID=UPI0008C3E244|nr:HAMP domain-containing sensor histidine kinase [Paenibacillus sp. OV219]SEN51538.1 His Kinase A (phospho-acceptor) domain-containing protein [Paenibacillus sp. OV219]
MKWTLKRGKKRDLFQYTQRKLTLTYTWLIILFLALFSIIVSVFFIIMTYQEQSNSLSTTMYATEDGRVVIPDLENSQSGDLYFFYVLDNQGKVLAQSDAIPQLSEFTLEKFSDWRPNEDKFRLRWQPELHKRDGALTLISPDRLLFIGAHPIMTANGPATIYAAKDVTYYWDILRTLLLVFIFILIIFVLVAIKLSSSMSKKAMIPIQQTFRQQQQFLADASHELRTPLSIMNTSLDVIELENGDAITPYSKEVVSDMKEEIGRMSRMVQHLLLLARSDVGSVEFEMGTFDIVPKLRQWVLAFEGVAQKKAIKLRTMLPDTLTVKGDPEKLKQLVYILLDNAIKYTPEEGKVDVGLDPNPRQWRIIVRDSGIGIAEADQPRIFDRFYRVEKHRSREEGSAGLGLAIAKQIAIAHRASVVLESAPGKGSTFSIEFPV